LASALALAHLSAQVHAHLSAQVHAHLSAQVLTPPLSPPQSEPTT